MESKGKDLVSKVLMWYSDLAGVCCTPGALFIKHWQWCPASLFRMSIEGPHWGVKHFGGRQSCTAKSINKISTDLADMFQWWANFKAHTKK